MKTMSALKMDSYRRRHSRIEIGAASIAITIDGAEYRCLNWSPGGFALRGIDGATPRGGPVTCLLRFAGSEPIAFAGTVVHVSKDGLTVGLAHSDGALDERLRALTGI